jgi:hypothetical protein
MQFVVVFHILTHGLPMIHFESLKDLFQLLKVKSISKKHWGMVEIMHDILLDSTKATFVFILSLLFLSNNQ